LKLNFLVGKLILNLAKNEVFAAAVPQGWSL